MSIIRNSDEDWSIISSSSDFDERSSNASVNGDDKNDFEGVIKNESDSFNDSEVTQLIKEIEEQGSIGSLRLPNLSGPSLRQSSFGSDSGTKMDIKSDLVRSDATITTHQVKSDGNEADKSVDKIISFYESLSANTLKLHKSIKEQGENLYTNKLKDLRLKFDSAMFDSVYQSVSNWMLVNSQYLIYLSIIPSSIMIYVLYSRLLVTEEPPQDFWNYSMYKSRQVFNDLIYEENVSWFGTKSKKNRFAGFLEYSASESVNILNALKSTTNVFMNRLIVRLNAIGHYTHFHGGYFYEVAKSKFDQFWGYSEIYSKTLMEGLKTNGVKIILEIKCVFPSYISKVKSDYVKLFESVKAESISLSKTGVQGGKDFYELIKNEGVSSLNFMRNQGQAFVSFYSNQVKPFGIQKFHLSTIQMKGFFDTSVAAATRMINFDSKNAGVLVSRISDVFKLYKSRVGELVNELYTSAR